MTNFDGINVASQPEASRVGVRATASDAPRLLVRALSQHLKAHRLVRELGAGAMASVYLALDERVEGFERQVALKVLHPHLSDDRELVRAFLQEARIASRIRHPNVVSVLDVRREDELVYLVMDYVDGLSLARLIRAIGRESLSPRVGLRILCDALAGLHAAHELTSAEGRPFSLVHRDVSPQNILVDKRGIGYLTDFGVAKSAEATRATKHGVIKGKLSYMAPEQARGRALDRRADIWAAGVIAWELLAGRRLFEARDEMALLLEVATVRPPRLSRVASGVPPKLEEVVASALCRAPEKRCPSAEELRARIVEAAETMGGLASAEEVAAVVAAAQTHEALRQDLRDVSLTDPTGPPSLSSLSLASTPATPPRPWRRRSVAALAALAATASAGMLVVRSMSQAPSAPVRAQLFSPEAIPAKSAASLAEQLRGHRSERRVIVRSDVPLAQLRLGDEVIDVRPPSRKVEVTMRGRAELEALGNNGRRVVRTVGESETQLELALAQPTQPVTRGRRLPPPVQTPLMKSPYE